MLTRALYHLVLFFTDPPKALQSAIEEGKRLRGDAVLLTTLLVLGVVVFVNLTLDDPSQSGGGGLVVLVLIATPLVYAAQFAALVVEAWLLSALLRFVRAPIAWEAALACAGLFLLGALPLSVVFLVPSMTAEPSAPFEITLVKTLYYAAYGAMVAYFLSRAAPRLGGSGALALALALSLSMFAASEGVDFLVLSALPPPAAEAPAA